jgi:hypothetical protein
MSCATSVDCWAIGTWISARGAGGGTLTEHWNGSAWTIVAVPNPPGRSGNELMGVSCVISADCWAWGSNVDGNLWSPVHWKRLAVVHGALTARARGGTLGR